ncbi:hypothetical protein TNCT_231051 [Trichonephila clavata]|uniref:Uncharacterized protein n=1 Tax=Trichonephila clavata TaxID=2740835 RepID=A0A8X6LUY8_TRICU|nr:hypothetical protein TNCT_231051 [Trichonephila clavata]
MSQNTATFYLPKSLSKDSMSVVQSPSRCLLERRANCHVENPHRMPITSDPYCLSILGLLERRANCHVKIPQNAYNI